MELIADTVFLIDLWRDPSTEGPATQFIKQHPDLRIGINWIVAGEFLSGALCANHDLEPVRRFLSRYPLIQSNPSIIQTYARLYRDLKAGNRLVGPNDLWIASTALACSVPLVTRNLKDFERIPDLTIAEYFK